MHKSLKKILSNAFSKSFNKSPAKLTLVKLAISKQQEERVNKYEYIKRKS